MAFMRHGAPEKIEVIGADSVDSVICQKCARVLIRAKEGARIEFSGRGTMIVCRCGEVANV